MAISGPNQSDLPTRPEDLFALFEDLGIDYALHHHDPVFTVEEGAHIKQTIPGTHCRNLFLRDKKKRTFLVVAANETEIDLKALPARIGSSRLSFGRPERLWDMLGIRPGSVCPFCVMNDKGHHVQVVLDDYAMRQNRINVHPLDNSMTVGISPGDLMRFLARTGHEPLTIDFSSL